MRLRRTSTSGRDKSSALRQKIPKEDRGRSQQMRLTELDIRNMNAFRERYGPEQDKSTAFQEALNAQQRVRTDTDALIV